MSGSSTMAISGGTLSCSTPAFARTVVQRQSPWSEKSRSQPLLRNGAGDGISRRAGQNPVRGVLERVAADPAQVDIPRSEKLRFTIVLMGDDVKGTHGTTRCFLP